ncbi:MAG: type II toxin-antitoxin system RelB/DinJ family antitoxin [Patescibacteria group bacterium]
MKTATSVKLDKAIKEEASKLASRMGLNLSSVVNATLKKFVTERRVVFSLSPEFNAKTERSFLKIKSDIRKRKNLIGPFDNLTDLKKSLLN